MKDGSKGKEYFKCNLVWDGHSETNSVGCCGKPLTEEEGAGLQENCPIKGWLHP